MNAAEHSYGPRVHLAGGAFVSTALARASADSVSRTDLLALVRSVYEVLLASALEEFPRAEVEVETRMAAKHPEHGVWRGGVARDGGSVVICDVIRAGILPAQLCFERLSRLLPSADVRLDHLNIARTTDESGRATGADLSGSKVGGTVEGSVLLASCASSRTSAARRPPSTSVLLIPPHDVHVLLPMRSPRGLCAVIDFLDRHRPLHQV